jgi:pyruvate ferredoxin oxidoreductase gamma subunit
MLQIRIHGRGGQGVVTAAEMLSLAAFHQGRHAQAFPSFGSERTGAPVVAFCRIDDREIRLREPVLEPDVLIIQDPTLLHQVDLFQGLKPDGYVLINSRHSFEELGLGEIAQRFDPRRLLSVPATEIAMKHLGRPLPNAVLLGGFAGLSGIVTLKDVAYAIRHKLSAKLADANAAAAMEAHAAVRHHLETLNAHAETN